MRLIFLDGVSHSRVMTGEVREPRPSAALPRRCSGPNGLHFQISFGRNSGFDVGPADLTANMQLSKAAWRSGDTPLSGGTCMPTAAVHADRRAETPSAGIGVLMKVYMQAGVEKTTSRTADCIWRTGLRNSSP